jgi:hypothetical protein
MTPFYEARGHLDEVGHLELTALPAAVAQGQVTQLAVERTRDPLKMVRRVRFHLKPLDQGWTERLAELADKSASVSAEGASVSWWAEALGERDAVLLAVGSEAAPLLAGEPSAPVAEQREPPMSPVPPDWALTRARPAKGPSPLRLVACGAWGAGVVALGVGAVLGALSSSARAQLDGAATTPAGVVTGLTQKQAYQLDATVRSEATAANVLFAVGGALAVTGLVLFLVSRPQLVLALAPTPQALVLSARW